ncbi:MAG TPA: mechanosensitive ion channel family protein [Candidatus Omnitrophota bacterium]|nr:mechanosensitive ion channel family protein [Candidatus Omnitrophota bacterium]
MMDKITNFFKISIFNNSIGDYLLAFIIFWGILSFFIIAKKILLVHLKKIALKTVNDLDDFIVEMLSRIGFPVLVVVSLSLSSHFLVLTESWRSVVRYALVIVLTIQAMVLAQELMRYLVTKAYQKKLKTQDASIESMVRSIMNVLRWIIWALGSVFILDNLGVNISALMAGIGIGGVAVAMASQAILGDVFSALSIFLDKPFEIGDFVIIDDFRGTIEYIGVKTTRIRSLSGEQLIFANSDLTKSRIKNYKRMDSRRAVFQFGIVYQTPVEKVKKAKEIVKDIFGTMAGVRLDRVHFQSFGDFSLIYEVVYYVLAPDYNTYMDKQEYINLSLMEAFQKEGISFAYPTQTLYVRKEGA